MGVGKFLIGCVLCVGSIGAASAMDADGQDLGTAMQRSVDSGSGGHDGAGGSGDDALGLSREANSTPSPAASSSCDSCPTPPPARAPRSRQNRIGWQSLLPGSIQ